MCAIIVTQQAWSSSYIAPPRLALRIAYAAMVSTRSHPAAFPPPEASPTKPSLRKSRTSTPDRAAPVGVERSLRERAVENSVAAAGEAWSHTASNLTIAWIAVSLPLVICTSNSTFRGTAC